MSITKIVAGGSMICKLIKSFLATISFIFCKYMFKFGFYISKYGVDICKSDVDIYKFGVDMYQFGVATQGRKATSRLY